LPLSQCRIGTIGRESEYNTTTTQRAKEHIASIVQVAKQGGGGRKCRRANTIVPQKYELRLRGFLEHFSCGKFCFEGGVASRVRRGSFDRLAIDHVVIFYAISQDATYKDCPHKFPKPFAQEGG
jgi:hypothetical protein